MLIFFSLAWYVKIISNIQICWANISFVNITNSICAPLGVCGFGCFCNFVFSVELISVFCSQFIIQELLTIKTWDLESTLFAAWIIEIFCLKSMETQRKKIVFVNKIKNFNCVVKTTSSVIRKKLHDSRVNELIKNKFNECDKTYKNCRKRVEIAGIDLLRRSVTTVYISPVAYRWNPLRLFFLL